MRAVPERRQTRGVMRRVRYGGAILSAAVVAACGSDNATGSNNGAARFLSGVATLDGSVQATYQSSAPPAAGSGPALNATTAGEILQGGSSIVGLSSTDAFSHVVVSVQGQNGYYDLLLTSPQTGAQIVLTFPQSVPSNSFTLNLAAGTSAASLGAYHSLPVDVQTAGTGDVQVSLSWNTASDVDLHVIDPTGAEVWYGNQSVASGGKLDVDSNAGCSIDNRNNENATWASGTPPHGTYTVRVDYFANCGVTGNTSYVVTVHVKGVASTFSGTLSAADADAGAEGSGRTITTFTY
jgi:hypothetical protein